MGTLEIARENRPGPSNNEIYIPRDVDAGLSSRRRSIELNDGDRSPPSPLLKGVEPTAPFFPVSDERGSVSPRSDHGSGKKNRSGMIPARTLRVASVPRICIWSGALLWRDIHPSLTPPPSPSPPRFFPSFFSLVSYRCLPALFEHGGHTGGCDRSPRHGGCEREGRRAKTSRRGLTGPP